MLGISKDKGGRALQMLVVRLELQDLKESLQTKREKQNLKSWLHSMIKSLYWNFRKIITKNPGTGKDFPSLHEWFCWCLPTTKREENAFEFADISHYTIEILENFPQVRREYQERFHEVMVDEYQDTNHIQERMLELLSNGHNRFMVGDIKQSIYRFRQADPQIFNENFTDLLKMTKKVS